MPLVAAGIVTIFLLVLGVFFYDQQNVQQEAITIPFARSVTILPFTSIGSVANLDAEAAGLTEEITGLVGSYQELQTISASSDTATTSGANYQVKGRLRARDDGIHIPVQLVRADSGQPVWSGSSC